MVNKSSLADFALYRNVSSVLSSDLVVFHTSLPYRSTNLTCAMDSFTFVCNTDVRCAPYLRTKPTFIYILSQEWGNCGPWAACGPPWG